MEQISAFLLFITIILVGLVLYRPFYEQYFLTYGVRIKARKKEELSAAAPPKESAILNACKAVGDFTLGLFPQLVDERTTQLLVHAGYRTQAHVATYIGIKTIVVTVLGVSLLMSSAGNPLQLLAVVPGALVAWIMPNFFLAQRVRRRQNAIVHELPTVIDLLIVCAQAGLGLLMCFDKVSKEVGDSCPYLAAEFTQLLQDVKIFAKSVATALKDMGDRCGVEELTGMAAALISAEAKGSDISYPLRQQSEALRDKLKRKKEEEASKVPVKMVPVIMIFIMPLIMCPMLGPAVITIMQALGPVFGTGK
jgi:tight adherence protein C